MAHVLIRRRHVVLSPKDEADYGALLSEAFPEVRFYDELCHAEENRPGRPPRIPLRRSLADCRREFVGILFEPDWKPRWHRVTPYKWRTVGNWPYPNGHMERSGRILPASERSPESIPTGEIYFRCFKGDAEHMAVARKALRLLTKVAVNRCMSVDWPSMEVVDRCEGGGRYWIGHDAIRWAREDPSRFVGFFPYASGYWGFRPLDE